jgi:predicted N-acyltransferase
VVRPLPRGRELSPTKEAAYELRIQTRIRDVGREAWDALVADDASPFVEWTWLDCLEEAGCVGRTTAWTPVHFTLYRGDRLVAAAPAYVKENSEGEFVFDWGWADASERAGIRYYPKLVVAVPFTPATGDRVLVAKGEDRQALTRVLAAAGKQWLEASGVSSAHVLFPKEAESQAWAAGGYAPRFGVQYHWSRGDDATWEDFLGRFNSKRRNALKRESSQAARDGVAIDTLRPDELTPEVVREMHTLYGLTVDKFYYGRRYLNLRFFELVAERFAHRLAWVVARKEGRTLAGAFNVQRGGVLYGRYWGSHVEMPFLHFNVCYYHGIRHCLANGLHTFEPGAGGEHKRVRGFVPTITRSNHWIRHPRLREAIEEFLGRERDAVTRRVASGDDGDE